MRWISTNIRGLQSLLVYWKISLISKVKCIYQASRRSSDTQSHIFISTRPLQKKIQISVIFCNVTLHHSKINRFVYVHFPSMYHRFVSHPACWCVVNVFTPSSPSYTYHTDSHQTFPFPSVYDSSLSP